VTGRRLDPFDERETVDLWDLTRLLLRRWYFAVPMLLASVAVVVLAAQSVSPDYKATGYMQLIPAPSTGKLADPKAKPRPVNPWLDLGYAALGNAAALTVTDQVSLDKLAAEGLSDSVTVVLNERTPLFEIEAVGDSKEQATGTVRQVIKLLQADISAKQKQYGTQSEDTISTLVINDGSSPEQDGGKVKRVLIVAAGLGVLITTAATIALDYWLRRRSRRRDDEGESDTDGAATSEPVRLDMLESAEKTRVLRLNRPESVPRQAAGSSGQPARSNGQPARSNGQPARSNGQPAPANGNVYSGDRSAAEANGHVVARPANGVRESSAPAEPELGVDATVILPTPHQPRRASEKRP
jgi:hypothetical protein